jgi:hypothetical protein
MRASLVAIAIAAAMACSREREADRGEAEPSVAAPRPPDASIAPRPHRCSEVARHFVVEYLGLRQSDDLAVHIEKDCELNDWTQEERACWVAIRDMATHQRCVTEFAEPRMRRPDYRNPDDEEGEDDFLEEDEEEAEDDDERASPGSP